MRCAAFNTGPDFHLLDHIAPLAELMHMPLIVTEELNYRLAQRHYPQVEIRLIPDLECRLREIASEFDALFECKYWQPHLKLLFRHLFGKDMRLVFCPHGQSDKGYQTPLLAPYAFQDAVLLYGPLLIEMLQELNIALPDHAIVGNYRLEFYQKYRSFYDSLAMQELRIDRSKRTVLYAPTWQDADRTTSFFDYGAKVIAELPQEWNLIVKLHPLLEQRNPAEFYAVATLFEQKSNLFLVHKFPPIYPILSLVDVYLGDGSSIGYDFLHFGRPLYFFPTESPGRLQSCGTTIDPTKNIYRQLEQPPLHKELQAAALYKKTFGDQSLRGDKITRVCKSLK